MLGAVRVIYPLCLLGSKEAEGEVKRENPGISKKERKFFTHHHPHSPHQINNQTVLDRMKLKNNTSKAA
jgi:hypothetical protein